MPSQDPGRGVIVASGVGGAAGSKKPGPRVPTGMGFACGLDQSLSELHPFTSKAVANTAASVPMDRSRERIGIILQGVAAVAPTSYPISCGLIAMGDLCQACFTS